MKFAGELKNKVEAAKTREEVQTVLAEAGIELTDEELDLVAGGDSRQRETRHLIGEPTAMV